jgi:hypothetical protein
MFKEFFVEDEVSDYFNLLLNFVSNYPETFKDKKQSSLSGNCFYTLNLLDNINSKIFYNYIDKVKLLCEDILNLKLKYFYIHMIDYQNGGKMNVHKHNHNEDYSFILYLNSCNDGETMIYIDDNQYKIIPEKNKVLLFSSHIPHSAEYSESKRVLVGGLRTK